MKGCSNRKKPRNRYDYGGLISQQIHDLYKDTTGTGLPGLISTSFDGTYKQSKQIVDSAYNFNPIASNNDELIDLYDNYRGLKRVRGETDKEYGQSMAKNILTEVQTGTSIGGSFGGYGGLIGAGIGLLTGGFSAAVQSDNINHDIRRTNEYINAQNAKQDAALANAATNLATRQKLGFEAGYFRDGGDINYFNNGGTHEQNPYGGIPQGIAPNGLENVVEEGEIKWTSPDGNDFIFSNSKKLTEKDIKDNLLPNSLIGKTIADGLEYMLRESKERENDPISNNGKDYYLNVFKGINESKLPKEKNVNSFDPGGTPLKQIRPDAIYFGENAYKVTNNNKIDTPIKSNASNLNLGKKIDYFKDTEYNQTMDRINNLLSGIDFSIKSSKSIGKKSNSGKSEQTEPPKSPEVDAKEARAKATGALPIVSERSRSLMNRKINEGISGDFDRQLKSMPINEAANALNSTYKYTPSRKSSGFNADRLANGITGALSAIAPMLAAAFDKPNYNFANRLANSFRPVDTPYISSANYMRFRPVDIDYVLNQIRQQGNANAYNLMNLSGGNRATALAGIASNDYSTKIAEGNALMQSDLQNIQKYQAVQAHNTGINQFDINQYTTNARFNAQGSAQAKQASAMLGQQEFDAWRDREYANLAQGLSNLQNLRREGWTDKQLQMLIDSGAISWDPRTGHYTVKSV